MISPSNQNLAKLDANFEQLLDLVFQEVKETELTPEKKRLRRAEADKGGLEFAKVYYGKIFDSPWNAVHKHIAGLGKGKFTVSGFRKSGKTAFTFVDKIVRPICYRKGGIYNVCLRTLDIARERTFHIYRLITRNPLIMYDFDIEVAQEMKGYYIINNCHLVASSVETGLRNFIDDDFKRFAISVNDDLYNRNSVDSQRDNDKVTNFITSEVYGQMEDDGLCITLGNSINEDCPVMRLKKLFPELHFSLPALDDNGKSTWPERFSDEYWKLKQAEMPYDVWMGEYQDKPVMLGNTMNPDWLRFIGVNRDNILVTVSAIDPARGESPSSCHKAIVTMSMTKERNQVIIEDIYLRRDGYVEIFDYVEALRGRFPHWKILLFENDFNQWQFADPYYSKWQKSRQRVLPIHLHTAKSLETDLRAADKDSRILNLVFPHQTGQIVYSLDVERTRDFEIYRNQFIAFRPDGRKSQRVDGLDAAATAYIMIWRYITTGAFQQLREKFFGGGFRDNGWFL